MPKIFTSKTQKIGEIGEKTAVRFLMKHGFYILDKNYTKKWGEIDIIAKKSNKLYFIEVKSISCDNLDLVSQETSQYRPEDNMHPCKRMRMSRTIQTYLLDKRVSEDTEWQVDLLVIYLDFQKNTSRVKVVSDVIL